MKTATVTITPNYYIGVQFSGAPKIYPYEILSGSFARDLDGAAIPAIPGDRVVVPTKMKSDGTVTLTIATIVAMPGAELSDLIGNRPVKPVVMVLPTWAIGAATAFVVAEDAAIAAAAAAKVAQ